MHTFKPGSLVPTIRKPIRLSGHDSQQSYFRGTDEKEISDAIRNESWQTAEQGRFDCRRNFSFDRMWNGQHYTTKQVRPIFVEEPDEIVLITVYVYYF